MFIEEAQQKDMFSLNTCGVGTDLNLFYSTATYTQTESICE